MHDGRLAEIQEWTQEEMLLQAWELAPELRKAEMYAIELLDEVFRLRGAIRELQRDAWERGMSDAKLQAAGIRSSVRNPYLED